MSELHLAASPSSPQAFPEYSSTKPAKHSDFHELVEDVKIGKSEALEELYRLAKNFTFFLMRQLGTEDLQDKVHDIFVTVAQAIIDGKLRDPERLVPFLTTVTRFYTYNQIERRRHTRKIAVAIDEVNVPDPRINLENLAYRKQKIRIARDILSGMPRRDRDVLNRFYLEEQTKEQICRDMQLTPTQFRLIKSKAKNAFTKIGAFRLSQCQEAVA